MSLPAAFVVPSPVRHACAQAGPAFAGSLPAFERSSLRSRHDKPQRSDSALQVLRMLALIQRVTSAAVTVDDTLAGAIDAGLLALVAVEPGDDDALLPRMAERLLGYRVFADAAGRMNRSLVDTGGGLLLVSQFTLAADTRSGMRPSFTTAAAPAEAERLFNRLVGICRQHHAGRLETGRFGAHMAVSLGNDGPATFLLRP